MYSNNVLKIFNNPQNAGRMKKPEGVADCYNEDNTAHVEFFLRIESGIITDCKFRAQANPYIVAICSTITNMIKGKMVAMIFLDPYSIKKELGDESEIDISFCINCIKMALDDYKEKLIKSNKEIKKEQEDIEEDHNQDLTEEIKSKEIVEEEKEDINYNEDTDDDFDFTDFFDDEEI